MESESAFNLNQMRSAQDHSISLHRLRCNPIPHSISPPFYSNFTRSTVNRFDRIATLGSYDSVNEELIGHSGCVNALDWNRDGSLLATGSDDRNIILWRMGMENDIATSGSKGNGNRRGRGNVRRGDVDSDQEESDLDDKEMKDRPKLDMGVKSVVETVSTIKYWCLCSKVRGERCDAFIAMDSLSLILLSLPIPHYRVIERTFSQLNLLLNLHLLSSLALEIVKLESLT